ncbi:MAG: TrkH family potassium uptake protein [Bacteroidaceae bacterium]|nr:TrkH family potassium uptake protein [Bacteroidaceae bacterium]
MNHWRQILKLSGILLFIETGMLLSSLGVAIGYGESIMPFLWTILISLASGILLCYFGRSREKNMGRRDGYLVVSLVWVLFSLVGMLPFLFSGSLPDVASAFFETMSGFTSTGATVIDEIDPLPHGILLWRSMTQWIGGIGIIFFTIAILPAFGVGEVKLFAAEATGPFHDKVHPRISIAVKWIGTVYLGLTFACIACLMLCGMDAFNAVNISMTTTATGGFAPHTAMFHEQYNSPAIEYVVTIFMFVSGMNYTLLFYAFLKGRFRKFFRDIELRTYLFIVLGITAVCTVSLMISNGFADMELSFRESVFTVVSIQTTTGFANCDYTAWPQALMPFVLIVMFAGACSGSTSGGVKCIRLTILWYVMKSEFKRIIHPRAILPVKLNGNVIGSPVQKTLLAFVSIFVCSWLAGSYLLILCGLDHVNAGSIALSSISNVGPAMEDFGPLNTYSSLSSAGKIVCSFLMLIGRLEIFPIFVIFTKNFWRIN